MPVTAEQLEQVRRSWEAEAQPRDEARWTPGAREGVWHAWTGKGAEAEWIALVAALVACSGARAVVETGAGGGYTTRRIAAALPPDAHLLTYESDEDLRQLVAAGVRSLPRVDVGPGATPGSAVWERCDLAVLDSHTPLRVDELRAWWEWSPAGSLVVVHDVSWEHGEGTPHRRLAEVVADLAANAPGFVWIPSGNPRGGIIGHKR